MFGFPDLVNWISFSRFGCFRTVPWSDFPRPWSLHDPQQHREEGERAYEDKQDRDRYSRRLHSPFVIPAIGLKFSPHR